jgi:hypothetical protein
MRAVPTPEDRRAVIEAAGGRCVHCGASDVPLEIRFIVPRSQGGGLDRKNLEAVCPNCHRILDSAPSEVFFVRFLADLLETHRDYASVVREPALGQDNLRPDLLATETRDGRARDLLIECKSFPVLSLARVENIRAQLGIYRAAAPDRQVVLAFPGRATPEVTEALRADHIEIWDIGLIGARFADQIEASGDGYYPELIERAVARPRPEAAYLADIKAITPGKEGWSAYQKLIGRLLELLFCPPLGSPLGEKNDFDKINRRDLIFANHVSDGFWAALRQRYGADYILVDAKNGARVKKSDVLQIANYLKPHGLGQFAIIMGRAGVERGVPAVLKEQWAFHGKLILVLNDNDLEEMVLAYGSGREQTQVLSDKIQAFRIGM